MICGQIVASGPITNVIRITAKQEPSATRLFLEGKLCGRCVDELDKCWQTCSSGEMALLVDLTNVSFVDEHGRALLARMHNQGIKLFSTSLMTKCLIEEIEKTAA
jgi:ABC-type transporter Mla MlaB component